jgi:hypothetical protein
LVPDAAASQALFVIGHQKSWQEDTFTTFATFETALAADLNRTTALLLIAAEGPYASVTGALSVDRLVVLLND